MKKILLLGSQHGDELLGDALYSHIKTSRQELLPFVEFVIGNLRAKKAGVRYIESDLNRSYTGGRKTYEERRAAYLRQYIKEKEFGLVLDLHTTTCIQPPCLIAPGIHEAIAPFLRASSIDKVVLMRHSIVSTSLIGVCKEAISIEVNKNELGAELVDSLCDDIARYLNQTKTPGKKTIYEINELLAKDVIDVGLLPDLRNFQKCKLGFYPVLVGENSYKKHTNYLGFKAHKVYSIDV